LAVHHTPLLLLFSLLPSQKEGGRGRGEKSSEPPKFLLCFLKKKKKRGGGGGKHRKPIGNSLIRGRQKHGIRVVGGIFFSKKKEGRKRGKKKGKKWFQSLRRQPPFFLQKKHSGRCPKGRPFATQQCEQKTRGKKGERKRRRECPGHFGRKGRKKLSESVASLKLRGRGLFF